MLHFWTYILRCADGSDYTGHTDNLEGRLWQHQQGIGCQWTRRRRPVELVWHQDFATRDEPLAAEFQIKPWSRAKKEALIRGDWAVLSHFARPPHERPSTSLGTNEVGRRANISVRPERKPKAVVDGREREGNP